MVSCDCWGEGIIKIKCPYKHHDTHPKDVTDPPLYLKISEDEESHLSHSHEYHQIQGHLEICEKEYCDFICWTSNGMHNERILPEDSYLSETIPQVDAFFVKVFLLLLTGCTQTSRGQSRSDLQSLQLSLCNDFLDVHSYKLLQSSIAPFRSTRTEIAIHLSIVELLNCFHLHFDWQLLR